MLGEVVVLGQDGLLDDHGLGLGRVQPGVLGVGQPVVVVVVVVVRVVVTMPVVVRVTIGGQHPDVALVAAAAGQAHGLASSCTEIA